MKFISRILSVFILCFVFLGFVSVLYWLKLHQSSFFYPMDAVYTLTGICIPRVLRKLDLFSRPWNIIVTLVTLFVGLALLWVGLFRL